MELRSLHILMFVVGCVGIISLCGHAMDTTRILYCRCILVSVAALHANARNNATHSCGNNYKILLNYIILDLKIILYALKFTSFQIV